MVHQTTNDGVLVKNHKPIALNFSFNIILEFAYQNARQKNGYVYVSEKLENRATIRTTRKFHLTEMLCSIQIDPLGQSLVEVALVPVGFPHRADELSAQVHRDLGNPCVE